MLETRPKTSRIRAAIWIVLVPDFLIFLLFIIPVAHHWVDRQASKLQGSGVADFVGSLIPVWLFGSTVFATILLMILVRKRRRFDGQNERSLSLRSDIALVTGWWLALLGLLGYGYALGMGG